MSRQLTVEITLKGENVNYSRPTLAEAELVVSEEFFDRDTAAASIGRTVADLMAVVANATEPEGDETDDKVAGDAAAEVDPTES